jgi:hypothetical protein
MQKLAGRDRPLPLLLGQPCASQCSGVGCPICVNEFPAFRAPRESSLAVIHGVEKDRFYPETDGGIVRAGIQF